MSATARTLEAIAEFIQARIIGDPYERIYGLSTLHSAKPGELSFLANIAYRDQLTQTKASAVVLTEEDAAVCHTAALILKDRKQVRLAYQKLALLFSEDNNKNKNLKLIKGIRHPSVVIGQQCEIHETVSLGPHVVIEDYVKIGKNSIVNANSFIGSESQIGENCRIDYNVSIYAKTQIGNRVIIKSNAIIGSEGFGFAENEIGQWSRISQLGRVILEDDVEIGAGTAVDRGALDDTIISQGVKIDNLVQIAHNVKIHHDTIIAACTGIAGSTEIGAKCQIGGASSIGGHLKIADRTFLTATSTVAQSIKKPGIYSSGVDVMPHRAWVRNVIRLHHLDEWIKKLINIVNINNIQNNKQEVTTKLTVSPLGHDYIRKNLAAFKTTQIDSIGVPEILACIPQRPPFLLIDRITHFSAEQKTLTAIKSVTINETFFQGHFPNLPIMPGVLILEALAQAGSVLATLLTDNKATTYYLAGIDKARFKHPVTPGDQLTLSVQLVYVRSNLFKIKAEAFVLQELVCSADILSMAKPYELKEIKN